MKRFEDFTKEDLQQLRNEITLNSLNTSDYDNSFGILPKSAQEFFEGYIDYLVELAEEGGQYDDIDAAFELDTIENLVVWFNCYDDFSWVEYDADFYEECICVVLGIGDKLGFVDEVKDTLEKAIGQSVHCYDDYIDDGIADEECDDEYLMCMAFEIVGTETTIRIYYGNNTRIIGDFAVDAD